MKRQRRGVKYPVEKRTLIAPPPIFPGKDHRMQTNLSTIFPTIRHGSLNNAYANIRVPRFMQTGKKSASLFEAQRPILLFFSIFFFLSRFTPLLLPLSTFAPATVGRPHFDPSLPPCPVISKKLRKSRVAVWISRFEIVRNGTTLSRFTLRYLEERDLADFHSIPAL